MDTAAHEKSRATWDEMAAGWEHYRDFMWATTGHVAEWLVANLRIKEGDTILDLAGGPGENGFLAARKIGPTGLLIETDFAPEMVEVARRRAKELGLENVDARVLDAQAMDLEDDSVDGIICRWGFMLMQDPQTALVECRRVLRNRRRLTLSVWAGPEQNPWVTVTGMTMMQLGHQPGNDPFGPGGMFSMSSPDTVRTYVTEAGFGSVTVEEMPVDWVFASFDEAWAFTTRVAGALAAIVKQLPDDEVERLRTALKENMSVFHSDAGYTLPGLTLNAVAF